MTCPKTGMKADPNNDSKAIIINGREISNKIMSMLKKEISHLSENFCPLVSKAPKLGYVLVGHRPDSELYVKMKKKT